MGDTAHALVYSVYVPYHQTSTTTLAPHRMEAPTQRVQVALSYKLGTKVATWEPLSVYKNISIHDIYTYMQYIHTHIYIYIYIYIFLYVYKYMELLGYYHIEAKVYE